MSTVEKLAVIGSMILVVLTFPFSIFFLFKVALEFERAVIFRLGMVRSGDAKGPGMFFVLPCIDEVYLVELRTKTCTVPPQEVLTKDSVSIKVDAVVYYRVEDALNTVTKVKDYKKATRLVAMTTLRDVLGTKTLTDILASRSDIARSVLSKVDEATDAWGIKVEFVEIKDIRLPMQLQKAMATEAEAQKYARAKFILAEGETKASAALKEASDEIHDTPTAIQLRFLHTLNTIAKSDTRTIIFPMPIDMFKKKLQQRLGDDGSLGTQQERSNFSSISMLRNVFS